MQHIHFIGIGGTGLSAIAKVLLEQGYQVSGSDLTASALFEGVRTAGGTVYQGHEAGNILGADLIVRSSAVPDENPEIQAARSAGISVLKRSEFLGRLMLGKNVIAVAGSHGKTTTTSMLSWILSVLDRDPSFIVGGVVENLGVNARAGEGDDFVIEADEYDYMFLGLEPNIALITNVEHDHPDIFPTEESFKKAFQMFVDRLQADGVLVLCSEDPGSNQMASLIKVGQKLVKYGFEDPRNKYWARDIVYQPEGGSEFKLMIDNPQGNQELSISLQLPGEHNVLNAVGAFAAADQLGLPRNRIAEALADFKGSERRFDIRGEYQGIVLIDDYAHHPTEIKTTLAAARSVYPGRRILGTWQPHTYSRTQTLFSEFTKAFTDADAIIVLNVFAAREQAPDGFSLSALVEAIEGVEAVQISGNDQAVDYLKEELAAGDVLLVLSAGDAIEISQSLEKYLISQSGN